MKLLVKMRGASQAADMLWICLKATADGMQLSRQRQSADLQQSVTWQVNHSFAYAAAIDLLVAGASLHIPRHSTVLRQILSRVRTHKVCISTLLKHLGAILKQRYFTMRPARTLSLPQLAN